MTAFMIFTNTLETEEQHVVASEIFEKYQHAMYWIAFRIVNNASDAEDVVMKAMENICMNIHCFTGLNENDTKLLVSSIVKNAAIDVYRKNKRYSHSSLEDYCLEDPEQLVSPEDSIIDLIDNFDFGSLQKHVTKLKEKYKIILLLKYRENLSNKEIGERLHIPVSTVATHLARAKKELKKRVIDDEKNIGQE